jgi:hypothetical protein
MKTQHVALYTSRSLLGESLHHLLGRFSDLDILGPWVIDEHALEQLNDHLPDIVVVVDEGLGYADPHTQSVAWLTQQILDQYEGLPVVQVLLEPNRVRIYNSHTVPARSEDLLEAIRSLGVSDEHR